MTELEMVVTPYEYQTLSYMGYELDGVTSVNDKELALLYASYGIVEYKYTIREAAMNYGFAKSTLHRNIHRDLRYLSPDLYKAVQKQMKKNLKNRGKRKRR